MDVKILTDTFEPIAIIDDFKSLIWTTRYYDCGDFELVTFRKYIPLIQYGYYIRYSESDRVGIVEYVSLSVNEDGQEIMLIKGRFLESILARRITGNIVTITDTPANIMTELVSANLTGTGARAIENFSIMQPTITGDQIDMQYIGINLFTAVSELAKTYNIGFQVALTSNNEFVFSTFKGSDRTFAQNENTYVIFSETYENLETSEYIEDYYTRVTDVLVGGEGEGIDRVMVWTDDLGTGLNRYESFIDAQSSSSQLVEYAKYLRLLKEEGKEVITQFSQTFSGTVDFRSYIWNRDVFIGDIVEIRNERWGVSVQARIIEVIESIDESGMYSVIPTFAIGEGGN